MKPKKFKFHFNRINMQRGNPNVWTIHQADKCFQVQTIECHVPVQSVFKAEARQPRAYFVGLGTVKVLGTAGIIN